MNAQLTEVLTGIRSEITVDVEGKGSITRNGLCVLLGISRSSFRVDRPTKKLAESLSQAGFAYDDIFTGDVIPDMAVGCIIEYYAFDANQTSDVARTLFRAFSAIGIRAWFQDVTGYQQTKPQTELERAKLAYEYMGKMIAVMEYASDKPGQQRINDYAVHKDSQALPGYITLRQVLINKGLDFNHKDKSAIGMYISTAYRNLTGKAPVTVAESWKDGSGKYVYRRKVPSYPLDFLPVIGNAIELGFGSSH
jgi:hypothetical protein